VGATKVGGRLKFRFQTRLAGLKVEVGVWNNQNEITRSEGWSTSLE